MNAEAVDSKSSDVKSKANQDAGYKKWLLFGTGIAVVLYCANIIPRRLSFGTFYETSEINAALFPRSIGIVLLGAALLVLAVVRRDTTQNTDFRSAVISWIDTYGPSMFAIVVAVFLVFKWEHQELSQAFIFEPPKVSNSAPVFAIVDGSRVSYLVTYPEDPRCDTPDKPYTKDLPGIAVGAAQKKVLDPLVQALTACALSPDKRGLEIQVRGYASSSHGDPQKACGNPCNGRREARKREANGCVAQLRAEAVADYLSDKIGISPSRITHWGLDNPGPLLYVDTIGNKEPKYVEKAGSLNRRVEITIMSAAACGGAGVAIKPRPEQPSDGSQTAQAPR